MLRRTELLPTELRRESEDDKQDKRCYRKVLFCDADTGEVYTDLMELHILERKKLPPEDQNEAGIIRWMRFLSGKSRKESDHMAEKDEYIREAGKTREEIAEFLGIDLLEVQKLIEE